MRVGLGWMVVVACAPSCSDGWRPAYWPKLEPLPGELACTGTSTGSEVRVTVTAIVDYDDMPHVGPVRVPEPFPTSTAVALQECYASALDRDPRSRGRLAYRRARAAGKDAGCYQGTSLRDGALVRCAISALARSPDGLEAASVRFIQVDHRGTPEEDAPWRRGPDAPDVDPDFMPRRR